MQIFFDSDFEWQSNCSDFELCANSSLILLDTIKYTSIFYVIFGLMAFIFSLPVLSTICFSASLRTNKSFFLIGNLAVWDLLMSSSFLYRGASRLYHLHIKSAELMSQYQCLLEETAFITSLGGNIVVFFLTALDRLMAIMFPKWYQLQYPKSVYVTIIVTAYAYLFLEVASLYKYSDDKIFIPICSYSTVTNVWALKFQGYRTKFIVLTTILIYIVNIILIYYQLKQAKKKGLCLSVTRKQLQARVLLTLLLILLSFVLTVALAHVMYSVALVQSDFKQSLTLATFCGSFVCINGISNFPILYCRSKSFKIATKHVFMCCRRQKKDLQMITPRRNRRLTNQDLL